MSVVINDEEWLTMQETADLLGVKYSDVGNLIHYHNAFITMKVGAGRLVKRSSAEQWKAAQPAKEEAAA